MKYLIGIDTGTSGTKTVLFDKDGNMIKSKTVEYPMYQPHNGWAEQNPDDWWTAVKETLKYVGTENVAGIGLSGQMHGLVMLDDKCNVIRPAIIWCDQRTSAECDEITNKVGKEKLINITTNPALTGFTASKILWVKNHEPENYKKCRHILLPKDYIRYKLTGEFATDVSDASGMQLLDVKKRCWSDEILNILGIEKSLLPKVYESAEITGYYNGIPVAAGGGDNACAAVGCGVVKPQKAFTTIGTSGVVYAHTDTPVIDKQGRIHTFCCAVPGKWHVMGVTQAAGLSLKWFRKNFAEEYSYHAIDELAKTVQAGADGLFYLPYLMGERTPHLDPKARGVFFGISAVHTKKDFARAVLEGVIYSLRDCLEVLRENNIETDNMIAAGGGAKSELWRIMMADVFNVPTSVIPIADGVEAALGAAILAGTAAGVYTSVESVCKKICVPSEEKFPQNAERYNEFYEIYKSIYPSVKDIFGYM